MVKGRSIPSPGDHLAFQFTSRCFEVLVIEDSGIPVGGGRRQGIIDLGYRVAKLYQYQYLHDAAMFKTRNLVLRGLCSGRGLIVPQVVEEVPKSARHGTVLELAAAGDAAQAAQERGGYCASEQMTEIAMRVGEDLFNQRRPGSADAGS